LSAHRNMRRIMVANRGEIAVPGGVIFENDLISVSHAQLFGEEKDHYLGHVFVEAKRHVSELADLTEQEAQAVGLYTSRAAKALLQTEGMEHVYTFFIGDEFPENAKRLHRRSVRQAEVLE